MAFIQDITKSFHEKLSNWVKKLDFVDLTGKYMIKNSDGDNLLVLKKTLKTSDKVERAYQQTQNGASFLVDEAFRKSLKNEPLVCVYEAAKPHDKTPAPKNVFENLYASPDFELFREKNQYSFSFVDEDPLFTEENRQPFTFPLTFALRKETLTYEDTKSETLYATYVDHRILKKIIPNFELLLYLFPEQITDLVMNIEKYDNARYGDLHRYFLLPNSSEYAFRQKVPIAEVLSADDETLSITLNTLPSKPKVFDDFDLAFEVNAEEVLQSEENIDQIKPFFSKLAFLNYFDILNPESLNMRDQEDVEFRKLMLLNVLHRAQTLLSFSERWFFPDSASFQTEVYNFVKSAVDHIKKDTKKDLLSLEELQNIKALYNTFWQYKLEHNKETDEDLEEFLSDETTVLSAEFLDKMLDFSSIHVDDGRTTFGARYENMDRNAFLSYLFLETRFEAFSSLKETKDPDLSPAQNKQLDQKFLKSDFTLQMIPMEEMLMFLKDVCGEKLYNTYIDDREKKVKIPKKRTTTFVPYLSLPPLTKVSTKPLVRSYSRTAEPQKTTAPTQSFSAQKESTSTTSKYDIHSSEIKRHKAEQFDLQKRVIEHWENYKPYFASDSKEKISARFERQREVENTIMRIFETFDASKHEELEEVFAKASFDKKAQLAAKYESEKSRSNFSLKAFQEEFMNELKKPSLEVSVRPKSDSEASPCIPVWLRTLKNSSKALICERYSSLKARIF